MIAAPTLELVFASVLAALGVAMVVVQFRRSKPVQPTAPVRVGQFVIYRPTGALCRVTELGRDRDGSGWVQLALLADDHGRVIDGHYDHEPQNLVDPISIDKARRIIVGK